MKNEETTNSEKSARREASELSALLSVTGLTELADRISMHMPPELVISLHIENGSASVTLKDSTYSCDEHVLPDPTDKTLMEQLHDALLVANGWNT